MKSSIKRKQRKTYKKKAKKQIKYNKKRRTFRKRKSYKQKGGFVLPFIDEGKNVFRNSEYQLKNSYNSFNPKPYAAPSNPTMNVNPHPAYDQYSRNNGAMIDPSNELGTKLYEVFDKSILSTQKF